MSQGADLLSTEDDSEILELLEDMPDSGREHLFWEDPSGLKSSHGGGGPWQDTGSSPWTVEGFGG